jgi:hypothetical protein
VSLPDLTTYAPHRSTTDAEFEGTIVPGLRADFYRRPDGDRIASVGRYSYRGQDVLMAWGYVDEKHCRQHAVHTSGEGWSTVADGCPDVRFDDGFQVRTPAGEWLRA